MSWDRKTRQLISKEHATKIIEIERSKLRAAAEKEVVKQYKQSDKCKRNNARRALQQKLDKANKANPENKIQNTIEFLNETIAAIKAEYKDMSAAKGITKFDIIEISKGYAVHIKILKKFDETTELNASFGYSEKLLSVLERNLNEIDPKFLEFIELPTIDLLSL